MVIQFDYNLPSVALIAFDWEFAGHIGFVFAVSFIANDVQ